jgi:hypothetical protein
MEEIYDALVDLKATMEKQMALQEQTNAIVSRPATDLGCT